MPKFRKKAPVKQEIPTSALPDIIFILLFFFMVVTKPRPVEPNVDVDMAGATEIQRIPEQMETINLYVGKPKDTERYGSEPVIQAGGKFIAIKEIGRFLQEEKAKIPLQKRKPSKIIINVEVDKNVDYGLIDDMEEELSKYGFLNINYKSKPRNEDL